MFANALRLSSFACSCMAWFAMQSVVATALQKSRGAKKNNSLAVIFVVRPQGLEPWTH